MRFMNGLAGWSKRSLTRQDRCAQPRTLRTPHRVVPAQAGTHTEQLLTRRMGSRLRGNDVATLTLPDCA
jgi:hypothetical protein